MRDPDDTGDGGTGTGSALFQQLRLALDAGGLGTWRSDLRTGHISWDERLERIFGLDPGTFDGTTDMWMERVHPDDRSRILLELGDDAPHPGPFTVRHRVVWPDGTERWIEGWVQAVVEDDEVVGTIGCARDVTRDVVAEAAQRAQVAYLERVADAERLNRERLEFLLQINDALSHASTVQEVMRRVTRAAVPRLGDWCFIHVLPYEGATTALIDAAHSDPEMVESAARLADRMAYDLDATWGASAVIRVGRPEFFPQLDVTRIKGISDNARRILMSMGLRSSIVVPIKLGDRTYGAITFLMTFGSRPYSEQDLMLAESVAGRVALALENLDLVARQVEIAQVLQESLLPGRLPTIPHVELAVRYTPGGEGTEVGGDFYDVFELDDERAWGIAVGDVCGQGPLAAALTGLARHTIRSAAWRDDDPGTVLERLNEAVFRSETDSFCTAVYGVLDAVDRRLRLALGGHPLPILVRPDGSAEQVGSPGLLIGAFEEARTSRFDVDLPSGSFLVLYTDGVTDVPPPHELSPERWAEIVGTSARSARSADHLADLLVDALDALRPARALRDDVALLVLRSV
ncbi:SpoIIE family protein phosphatase [Actinomarinicola tropica]|uniref:SpoIIE family protein phosphatase n=1 Tax=Actinomarinicola tropica TaxID=2789776 RepID=A0A5Q2RQW0_9ACTN|nr:SpoIIE family protein phosphatase [Actinomarinicola tropica]QGG96816.1 SpoIIE family protein phosphatase [Actinomarinicola tropica]